MRLSTLLILFTCASTATAERIFTSGFETNNFTATEWAQVASCTIETASGTPHSGSYYARCVTTTGGVRNQNWDTADKTTGSYYYGFYIRIAALPSVSDIKILQTLSSASVEALSILVDADGSIDLRNTVTGTTRAGSATLSINVWYRFDVTYTLSDTVGVLDLEIYDDSGSLVEDFSAITGEDTLATNVRTSIHIGLLTADGQLDLDIDDVRINNEAGTFETGLPGAGKIAFVEPTSDNTVTWTKTGANCSATTNTDCVDDEPGVPDDDSGYNASSATAGDEDRLNKTALPAEVPSDADMVLVHVLGRTGGGGTTGNRTSRLLLWDDAGAQTLGATSSNCDSAAGTWLLSQSPHDLVFDLSTRSKATVDDADFDLGYENVSAHACRTTALWANVEWTEAPAAPSCAQSIALLGVGCR